MEEPNKVPVWRKWLNDAESLFGLSALAFTLNEHGRLAVTRQDILIENLPPALDGFKIAHLSDFHSGNLVGDAYLKQVMETASSLKPDLIALTGDFIHNAYEQAARLASLLPLLKARYGVFGSLGNHDYWCEQVPMLIRDFQSAGVRMLVNQSMLIRVRDAHWWIGGIDDALHGRPDLKKTFLGAPTDDFKLLLCHEPDYAEETASYPISLQLSGHSHGGQVCLPKPIILPALGKKYSRGLYRVFNSGLQVFTTTGVGVVSPPLRLNCKPEVALLTLRSAR